MIRVHLKIHGRVQGVFFRASTQEKAEEIGDITGWAANNADGTVDIVAEGPENKIMHFIEWCSSGPSGARVDKVEKEDAPYTAEFSDFTIRY